MPSRQKKSQGKTQTTLSKFFTSNDQSQSISKNSVSGSQKPIITDADDDFQVISNKEDTKRSKLTKHKAGDGPANKVVCNENGESTSSASESVKQSDIDVSVPDVNRHQSIANNKLKNFEYLEGKKDGLDHFQVRPSVSKLKNKEISAKRPHESNSSDSDDDFLSCSDVDTLEGSLISLTLPSTSKSSQSLGTLSHRYSSSKVAFLKSGEKRKGCDNGKYTPLEQQYLEIKSQYPDAVLFVECGYKYRFFGKDAEIAAEVLKIFCHKDHNFMTASIPVHRLFVHIRRLVATGYKVGVVKQTETSHLKAAGNNKTGPFTRKLKALYTKSTLIGEDVDPLSDDPQLEEGGNSHGLSSHHLMCVYQSQDIINELGFVCVDPATGEVIYDHFKDNSMLVELETRIAHLRPVEVLMSVTAADSLTQIIKDISNLSTTDEDKIRIEFMKEEVFAQKQAISSLTQFYNKDQMNLQRVLSLPKLVISCLAALYVYLQDFQLDRVLSMASHFKKFSERSHYMYLSRQCLHNLEIFHNTTNGSQAGSLYWMLNHTCTKFGGRLLHKWLAQPLLDIKEIKSRQTAVEELVNGQLNQLINVRDMMSKLPDLERGLGSIFHKKCSLVEFCNVVKALQKVQKEMSNLHAEIKSSLMASVLTSIPESLTGVNFYCGQINEKAARENDKANLFVDDSHFPDVCKRKQDIEDVLQTIQDHRKEVRLTLKQPSLQYTTVMQTEFLIEVKNSQLSLVPSSWTQISSTKAVSRFHTPFIVKQYRKLCELREQLIIDVTAAWQQFLDQFSVEFVTYKQAVNQLAVLDCLMSLAMTASQDGYCRPQIDKSQGLINIDGGRHPIIDAITQGQDQYVPNNTKLDSDKTRVMVISGPNMGGKSSYIRQVALICIMAQCGSYVPAVSANLGIIDAIYTRMGANDEIFQGRSTLMVELQEAGEIIAQMTDRSLIVMDELGRGTSTHDGLAIAHATLEYLIHKSRCFVLFVTHFPMLSKFQELYSDIVKNCHMAFLVNSNEKDHSSDGTESVTFLYQLTEGAAHRSYGLNVARLAQVPPAIVLRAAEKSHELEMKVTGRLHRKGTFMNLYTSDVSRLQTVVKQWQSS